MIDFKKRACFILASTYNRVHILNKCISHLKQSEYGDYDIYLYFQGDNLHEVQGREIFKDIVQESRLRGIFTPRFELMKRFGINYDYCILIDDDLFVNSSTDYLKALRFCDSNPEVGCISLTNWKQSVRNEIEFIDYPKGFNVCGGMCFPKRSIEVILDYFKGKEADYTEDMFWLLLWVKGYDLYLDHRSYAFHSCNSKSKDGGFTGYSTVRMESKYLPILGEYFNMPEVDKGDQERFPKQIFGIKSLRDAKPEAFAERKKNKEAHRGKKTENKQRAD